MGRLLYTPTRRRGRLPWDRLLARAVNRNRAATTFFLVHRYIEALIARHLTVLIVRKRRRARGHRATGLASVASAALALTVTVLGPSGLEIPVTDNRSFARPLA